MNKCIDRLGEAAAFSKLNTNSKYWQIDIDERNHNKTLFISHYVIYRLKRMPLWLQNDPAVFQRAIDVIISSVRWQLALQYLDDIAVFSNSPYTYMNQARRILLLLYKTNVLLNLKKRWFFADIIDNLEHVIRSRRLKLAVRKTDAVVRLGSPTTQTKNRLFLDLCSVFRLIVPNLPTWLVLLKRVQKDQSKPLSFRMKWRVPRFRH